MAFDPSTINVVPSAEMMGTVVRWLSMIVTVIVWCVIALFIVKFMRYRIPAEIFEVRGNAIVKTKNTKLKEIIKDNVTKFEVRTLMGLILKNKKEFYYNTSEEYKIPTVKGYKFYLLKMGFNAYNPMRMQHYTNELDKINEKLKNFGTTNNPIKKIAGAVIKKKQEMKVNKEMSNDKELNDSRYTYVPIPMADLTAIEFEPIPQNLLPVLARSVVETNQIYSQQKWWEPYMFPLSIFALCIVQVIVMGWMFDKVGDVGGACKAAESSIVDTMRQKLA